MNVITITTLSPLYVNIEWVGPFLALSIVLLRN